MNRLGANILRVQQVNSVMVNNEMSIVTIRPITISWVAKDVVKAIHTIINKSQFIINRDIFSLTVGLFILCFILYIEYLYLKYPIVNNISLNRIFYPESIS